MTYQFAPSPRGPRWPLPGDAEPRTGREVGGWDPGGGLISGEHRMCDHMLSSWAVSQAVRLKAFQGKWSELSLVGPHTVTGRTSGFKVLLAQSSTPTHHFLYIHAKHRHPQHLRQSEALDAISQQSSEPMYGAPQHLLPSILQVLWRLVLQV